MAGEDHTNKPDLRATPEPQGDPDAGQKDAPLPAFIYGRDGQGDGNASGGKHPGDRQNLNARIADMDRKTLLGLVTGAGMLGLVLFFAGMLVGAGLFMDSDDAARTTQTEQTQVEMLASAPEEPEVIEKATPEASEPVATPEIAEDSDDPVGDLIAQRTEALADDATNSEEAATEATETAEETAADATDSTEIAAPEIRDVTGTTDDAPAAPAAPEAPAVDSAQDSTATEAAEAEAEEPVAQETETAAAPELAPSAPATESAANADKPFSVQVGAFKVHENASQRAEELRGEGLEVAVVVRGPEDEGAWYYVRIGSYATLAAARDDAAKIKADHSLDGFPVRAEPNDRVVN
ncbi:SPOR domain-containing protein [Thalassospira sp. HJ]|uniref:SPOR domain-containing protein n=1 Tax=Thalassospira sp. HJ TaxID=1616823 RepID=UPI000B190487|nr:SPOR domain-containing protein [Thalassospira sp. HJ]